jgi:hypothetical protein
MENKSHVPNHQPELKYLYRSHFRIFSFYQYIWYINLGIKSTDIKIAYLSINYASIFRRVWFIDFRL